MNSASILIVDDKASSREFLKTLLEHHGYRTLEAADGAEALQLARSARPDLIITDILMPTMDGYELVRQLRADRDLAATRVIFCSAHYEEREVQALARECGVSSLISKPFPANKVLAAVENALGANPPRSASNIPPSPAAPSPDFDREHLRLLTDKLSQKADDLQATNNRLAALLHLSTQFASELDTRRLLQSFVHGIREIVGARAAVVGILDPSGLRFRALITSGMSADGADAPGSPDPDSELLQPIVRLGRLARIAGSRAAKPSLVLTPDSAPFQAWLGAPITSLNHIYGFAGLIDKPGADGFTEEDEHTAQILCAQVGRIYQNGSLYAEAMSHAANIEREMAARVEAERALAEREERIRLLLDSTAEAIYGMDLDGRCTFANAACVRLLGYRSQEELIGRVLPSLPHQWHPGAGIRNQPIHTEHETFLRADGTTCPVEYWSYPIVRGEEMVGAVVTFLDITQRRHLEAQYREAQRRLRHAVVSSPAVLLIREVQADHIGDITWISDNLPDILGYRPQDALDPDWWPSNTHPDDVGRIVSEREIALMTQNMYSREYRFRHADGSYRWIRSEFRLLRDSEGRALEAVGAWIDLSERKRVEEEQRALREQLQQAQKLESVGRLAGGVAHDFNNLLTVINGYSDLLVRDLPEGGELSEMAAEIGLAGHRAAELTRQLLLLSRKQVAETRDVNLNTVIEEVRKMLARVIGEDIKLEFELDPELGYVLADPSQLHQVLMNLAVNARDAMPQGGTLLIQTRNISLESAIVDRHTDIQPGAYIELVVRDTGVGMSRETLEHLFEPFFTTKAVGQGTGLGLATVYGIVKQAGGAIWVYSEPQKGSSFKIYLPRVEAGDLPPEKPRPTADKLRGSETILVVEDQEQLLKIAASVLRGYGYQVLTADSPYAALRQSASFSGEIQLLLTDMVMPEMNGVELAERLQSARPRMRLLFMSGYSERRFPGPQSAGSGVPGAHLDKPFSPEQLALKVKEVLATPRPATILLVDDEAAVRKLLRGVLSCDGYHVLEADNGRDALRQMENNSVDLVLTDLSMPEQDGFETITQLRQARPNLKIVATSGHFAGPLLSAAEYLGANASLAKPIEPDQLRAIVARLLAP